MEKFALLKIQFVSREFAKWFRNHEDWR